jgi:peroxiredoxin
MHPAGGASNMRYMIQESTVRARNLYLLSTILLWPWLAAAAAPDVTLRDMAGTSRNVNEFIGRGKWTVVVFWAHNCPICNREIHETVFFHAAHMKKDASVLGVSVDGWTNRARAQAFVHTHALDFPNLIAEPDQALLARFGGGPFYGTPTFYVYSPDGALQARQVGPVTQEELEGFIDGFAKTDAAGSRP